jgi:hypothetical protein
MSLALILVDRDNKVEKISTDSSKVTDSQARFQGIHTIIETGITRIATAMKILTDLAAAEIRLSEKYVTSGSLVPSPCLAERKRH